MNLGDLYRLAMQAGMTVKEDGGIKGDISETYLFTKKLEEFHQEKNKDIFDQDDML